VRGGGDILEKDVTDRPKKGEVREIPQDNRRGFYSGKRGIKRNSTEGTI